MTRHDDEERLGKAVDVALVRRLWPFVRPYRRGFALCLLILLVSFVIELLGPWLLRLTIDGPLRAAVTGGGDAGIGRILWLGTAYLACTVGGAGLGYAYAVLTTRNGQATIRDVRSALFDHVLRLDPAFFERNPAGRLVTRVTSDVDNLNELISTGVLQSLFDLLKIVGILGALVLVSPPLALFVVAMTPLVIGTSLLFRRHAREAYRAVRTRLAQQNAFTAEVIGGVRTARWFGSEDRLLAGYRELNEHTNKSWLRTVLQFSLFFSLVDLAVHATQVGLLWVGGLHIVDGALTVGVFVQFWLYFGKITDPIKELGEKYNVLQSAFASAERIFRILDTPALVRDRDGARPSSRGPAHIAFEGVDFAYLPGRPVLHEVSFEVPAGRTLAIVGPTGAGKSTILTLLSRLRDPDRGRVTLDGVDLRELQLASLRRRIAVVPQDVFLFAGTVLDNVRLFDDSIPEQRVVDALAAVGATDTLLTRLDGGLRARVDERGATFSQGERQLLSFARALAFQPDVLVLDEATANIDSDSEARIQRAMRVLLEGRTAIVVAHRLSTVRRADRILVLRAGRIAEAGTHDELMHLGGHYRHMVEQAN